MRVIFMGSPEFSVPALHALAGAHEVVCVYAQPPRPAGRGQRETRCAVHQAALDLGLSVRTPARLKRDAAEHAAFAALHADVAVVAAYGLILPAQMLDAPGLGCWNIHASLLPRWRGAAPIHAAVLAGDAESGITIMRMEEGLDTGPMLLRAAVPMGLRITTPELHDTLSALGARLILRALDERPAPLPQPEAGVTYAARLTKADGALDWSQPAAALERRVRAMNPWPGAWFAWNGEVIRVLDAVAEHGPAGPDQGPAGPGIASSDQGPAGPGHGTAGSGDGIADSGQGPADPDQSTASPGHGPAGSEQGPAGPDQGIAGPGHGIVGSGHGIVGSGHGPAGSDQGTPGPEQGPAGTGPAGSGQGPAGSGQGIVACGQGVLRLLRVQRPGRPVMAVADFLRGNTLP